jgi:hypothetical protein
MPPAAISALVALAVALGGCSGGAELGEACTRHTDCDAPLQCVQHVCAARCQRAPDCGDGYSCDDRGFCLLATGQSGDPCTSEVDCAPGLSCQIQVDGARRLIKRCADQTDGAPAGAVCAADGDCRNATCALGRCVDLCRVNRDCAAGMSCMQIPHIEAPSSTFAGCLITNGVLSWPLPTPPAGTPLLLPVPSGATHAALVVSTAAPRSAAAVRVVSPSTVPVFQLCPRDWDFACSEADQRAQFYVNQLRHRRDVGLAVLAIPSTSQARLEIGTYRVLAKSFHIDGSEGPPPAVTAVVRLGAMSTLDLHFHFLDLADHPCEAAFDNGRLDRTSAQAEASFQNDFLGNLRSIFKESGSLTVGEVTYDDISRPDLDGLEVANAGALLQLGGYARGVNVFFVRNLSPVGIQAFGPNPGPAGLAGTARSGIVIGIDTLCYRSWKQLARLTAHEIARYMGLYENIEISGQADALEDTDASATNLMFYSELGGLSLSPIQRELLSRSPVLR